jgi:hypothetical protein
MTLGSIPAGEEAGLRSVRSYRNSTFFHAHGCAFSPGGELIRALISTFSGFCKMNLRGEQGVNKHAD